MLGIGKQAVVQFFADHLVGAGLHGFKVAVVAAFQATLAVTHIHGVGCTIEQGAHECQLVIQRAFGVLALANLQAQAGIPEQGQQQKHGGGQHYLQGKAAVAFGVVVLMPAKAAPAVVDYPQLER